MLFSSQLLPEVQRFVAVFHHFFVLFQLVHGHKVVILHNLKGFSKLYIVMAI